MWTSNRETIEECFSNGFKSTHRLTRVGPGTPRTKSLPSLYRAHRPFSVIARNRKWGANVIFIQFDEGCISIRVQHAEPAKFAKLTAEDAARPDKV